jgi:hypothetical protein
MKLTWMIVGELAAATALAGVPAGVPVVQLDFQIVDMGFRAELGTGRETAEKAFLPIFAKGLDEKIGFVHFSTEPPPAGERRYRLSISLGDAASAVGEVRFNLRLLTPTGSAAGQVSWPFRGVAEASKPLSYQSTVAGKIHDVALVGGRGQPGELARRFGAGNFSLLVSDILSKIPMASDGVAVSTGADPKWVLPLHRGDMCLDLYSRFRVSHLLKESNEQEEVRLEVEATGPPGDTGEALAAPIIARVPDTPDQRQSVGRLAAPGATVKVTAVFLTRYVRRPVCSEVSLPTDAISGPGGEQ